MRNSQPVAVTVALMPESDELIETAARVTIVNVADLRQWDRNPHSGDVQSIRLSLERFGQVVPIVRAPDGWVIAGNHTLKAMIELGWERCAVVTLDAEQSEQVAYGLASNRISELGEDDEALVYALLQELDVIDGTGYTTDDLADLSALMEELDRRETQSDEARHSAIDPDTGVVNNEPSMGERLDVYQQTSIRSVVLDFDLETFEYITNAFSQLRAQYGVASNSSVVEHLLRQVVQ